MHVFKPSTEGWLGKYENNTFENYQLEEYNKAVSYVKNKGIAIDVGANLGMMSYRMCREFEHVHSIEPLFAEYIKPNVRADNITIHEVAVGETEKTVSMRVGQYHSGGSNIVEWTSDITQTYNRNIKCVTIDSLNIKDVDFIKIDVEHYEWFALQGANDTIEEFHPIIMMEVKKDNPYRNQIMKFMKVRNYEHEPIGEMDFVFK